MVLGNEELKASNTAPGPYNPNLYGMLPVSKKRFMAFKYALIGPVISLWVTSQSMAK